MCGGIRSFQSENTTSRVGQDAIAASPGALRDFYPLNVCHYFFLIQQTLHALQIR